MSAVPVSLTHADRPTGRRTRQSS